jgi:Polysaccharide deacetylase
MSKPNRLSLCTIAAALAMAAPLPSFALPNSAKVPVLLYHSHQVAWPCDYANNASLALAQDLEMMRSKGFTVVPLYWIAEWATGIRDGGTLPDKVVGISFDDGVDLDWVDNIDPSHACVPLKSFRAVLQDFKAAHPDLPWYSPHAASFVVASPVARAIIGGTGINDYWWQAANSSGIMEIYNHSTDHDHNTISGPFWDAYLDTYIPVRGYATVGNWQGGNEFFRIDNYESSKRAVTTSASYISSKIGGAWPDLFAYPFGHASSYLRYTYFPYYSAEHKTLAAFSVEPRYVTQGAERYFLGRFSFGGDWTTPATLAAILDGAQ